MDEVKGLNGGGQRAFALVNECLKKESSAEVASVFRTKPHKNLQSVRVIKLVCRIFLH